MKVKTKIFLKWSGGIAAVLLFIFFAIINPELKRQKEKRDYDDKALLVHFWILEVQGVKITPEEEKILDSAMRRQEKWIQDVFDRSAILHYWSGVQFHPGELDDAIKRQEKWIQDFKQNSTIPLHNSRGTSGRQFQTKPFP